MQVGVLGPVRVHAEDGARVDIPGVRVRMLVARLALESGRDVPVPALIDGLWGEEPPADASGALQALVSRLRKALREAGTVEFGPGGYRLPGVRVDADRFEDLVRRGRQELAAGRAEAAARLLSEALELWRGPALGDVLDAPFAQTTATRLDELRAAALENRFEAELRLGRHAEIQTDLEIAAADNPLGERLAALRIRALAAAGRQADALAAYEETRARLDEELGIDPSAILRETHLALLRGELESPPPHREPVTRSLPVRLTGFVGRETELAELTGLLTDSRLVTIVGPGGAGKTRLAVEAMDRRATGAVFFVPLAELGAPDQLADAVAGALDAGPDRTTRLTELLDVGPAVLVLDNCEHVIAAAAALAEHLLDRLPQLRVLATSREPLAITGEALCHLGPLDVPVETADSAVAQRSSAVRLFADRAAAIRPGFVLDDDTVAPVVEICRQLDGLPLALELAAAKLRAMSVDQVARRLGDRFRLLSSGSRTALPRQRTLQALVEWSWDLLAEPEKILARRLSVFAGGATAEAVEVICADEELPADDILYLLDALVEKSLGTVTSEDPPRYRMLETIRAFAAGHLATSPDHLAEPFTDYYLTLAEQAEPHLRGNEQLAAIALFDAEHANLAAALRTALAAPASPEIASRLVRAMFWYWGIRGMSSQFESSLAGVLAFEQQLPDATRAAFRVIALMAGAPPTGSSLSTLIEDCVRDGGLEFHPAVPLWTALLAARAQDDKLAEQQLTQAMTWPDPWVRASAELARDIALTGEGRLPAGADARRAALRGFEIVGDRWGLGMALLATGRAHSLGGAHDRALDAYARAVTLASELGTEDDIAAARTALAEERLRGGESAEAARDIEAAQRLSADQGFARLGAVILFTAAELHRRTGDLDAAGRDLDHVTQRIRHLPYPEVMAAHQIAVARLRIHLTAAAIAPARELLPRVIAGSARFGDSAGTAQAQAHAAELLAKLLLLEEDPATAATALGLSEVIRGTFDHGEPELSALITALTDRLGQTEYQRAYRLGADLPRPAALERLIAESVR
ncbi:BTAD domain-containing putative transcriptional regulator [Nocardia tengchongensis]|uniref:AfsR/SARP family transcriptional regulator n=1 Tax=Nocardia tengchongensis TaxID=2055889 RepID=UPI0036B71B60